MTLFIIFSLLTFGTLAGVTLSPDARRWANWHSFQFVAPMLVAGFALAIMVDSLRPTALAREWGDIYTISAILIALAPGLWAWLIAKDWTPLSTRGIATPKPKRGRIISVIWWSLAVLFIASAILSGLHVAGSGPTWWPPF